MQYYYIIISFAHLNFTIFAALLMFRFKQRSILLLVQSIFQEVQSQAPAAGCCHIPVTFAVYSETVIFGSVQARFDQ
jgi:hypothetical protein